MTTRTLILAGAFIAAGSASAATLASATFTNSTGTGLATLATDASNQFVWTEISAASGVIDIVDDSSGIGAGTAFKINASNTFYGVLGKMSSTTTLAIGDTLTVDFAGRYAATPANNTGGLRFGFTSSTAQDNTFGVQAGTGTSTALALMRDAGAGFGDNSALGGTMTSLTTGGTYAGITGTSSFTGSFSLTKTASGYDLSGTLAGTTLTGSSTTGWDPYDQIVIRNGGATNDLIVDNVSVSLTAVPEPSTYGLIGAGALAAVAFVRRRSKRIAG